MRTENQIVSGLTALWRLALWTCFLVGLALFACRAHAAGPVQTNGVFMISWSPSPSVPLVTNFMVAGTSSRSYTTLIPVTGTNYTDAIANLVMGTNYFSVRVWSTNSAGTNTIISDWDGEAVIIRVQPPVLVSEVTILSRMSVDQPWNNYATVRGPDITVTNAQQMFAARISLVPKPPPAP